MHKCMHAYVHVCVCACVRTCAWLHVVSSASLRADLHVHVHIHAVTCACFLQADSQPRNTAILTSMNACMSLCMCACLLYACARMRVAERGLRVPASLCGMFLRVHPFSLRPILEVWMNKQVQECRDACPAIRRGHTFLEQGLAEASIVQQDTHHL